MKPVGYFFVIFALHFFAWPAFAAVGNVLHIATSDFPPYSYQDRAARPSGVMTEIIQEVLKEIARDGQQPELKNLRIEYFPWKRAFKMASEGKNVLLYPVGISPEREALFEWMGPRLSRNIWIYTLKTEHHQTYKRQDFKGQSIGITRGYSWEKNILEMGALAEESVDDRTLVRKMVGNRMQFVAMDEEVLRYTLERMADEDSHYRDVHFQKVFPIAIGGQRTFGFSEKTDPALMKRFNRAYARLDQRGIIQQILNKNHVN